MSVVRPLLGAAERAQTIGDSLTLGMTHRFAVLIDNYRYHFGDWSKVSGLSVTWQPVEHRVGSQGNHTRLFPGMTRYEPITLSRSAGPGSRIVQSWLTETSKAPRPQSGTIQLLGFAGVPLVSWRLGEFFPIAWSIESFDAAGAKPAIETLKLAHTGFLDDDMTLEPKS